MQRKELTKSILLECLGYSRNTLQTILAETFLHYGGVLICRGYPNAILACKNGEFIGVKLDEVEREYDIHCGNDVELFIKTVNESYK